MATKNILILLVAALLPGLATAFQLTPASAGTLSFSNNKKNTDSLRRLQAVVVKDETTNDIGNTAKPDEESAPSSSKRLSDCVCLVTGASRGIGKGIALELASEGATVYVTGTSSSDDTNRDVSTTAEPGTVQDTAREIDALGGKGIAVVCNHAKDDDVRRLMDRIERDHGRLDMLINNCFRIPLGGPKNLKGNFWEQGADVWDSVHTVGLRSHYMASCLAMPLLFKARDRRRQLEQLEQQQEQQQNIPRPFIGMISSFGGLSYTFNVAYGVGKAGVDRLAKDMAIELQGQDVSVVSFWPGLVDTERTQLSIQNGDWEKYVGLPLDNSETPRFTGRAVVEVALDDQNKAKSGTYQVVAELAEEYGFTDVNGKTPPSIRSLKFLLPSYVFDEATRERIPSSWIPDWKLPFWFMGQGPPPAQD